MSIGSGTQLGAYEVQDFIGQGAMGVVFRAYHSQLERTGAVKVMQAITPDPDTVVRFRHEAQAIARLRHPNIVDVYDFGEYQGTPYMIVEYVPGGSLAAKMSRGILDRPTALRYLRGIADGLDYAHRHGVVHRDVKPANVLLAADDSPVLADFGLAKLLQGSSLKSMTGVTTGTPGYMSPEQVTGAQVGPAADRYSLATIAYEMLCGVIPFDGEGLMELLYAQVHRYPVPPSARDSSIGAEVDAVIMRGLAKNPSERWESCTAFVDALEAAVDLAPAGGGAATLVMAPPVAATKSFATTRPLARAAVVEPEAARTVAVEANGAPAVANPAPKPRPTNRRRLLIGVAAVLVLLLVMGVCAAVAQATTLTVNPAYAARGETVRVTAAHVPANQAGEIQLHSILHTYAFRADAQGEVAIDMTVPLDIALGDHVVKICWDNACHKDAALRVVAGVADVPSASPSPRTTPSESPVGSSPRPGSTPTPRSTPGSTPGSTPHPTSNPTSTPTSNPCPGNSNTPTLSHVPEPVLLSGGTVTLSGSNFTPKSTVTLFYYAPAGSTPAYKTWSVTAGCDGAFANEKFATKATLTPRNDQITACDIKKVCVSAKISIVL